MTTGEERGSSLVQNSLTPPHWHPGAEGLCGGQAGDMGHMYPTATSSPSCPASSPLSLISSLRDGPDVLKAVLAKK